jgi:hypothetical protein
MSAFFTPMLFERRGEAAVTIRFEANQGMARNLLNIEEFYTRYESAKHHG